MIPARAVLTCLALGASLAPAPFGAAGMPVAFQPLPPGGVP
jgi:hypothetical protein